MNDTAPDYRLAKPRLPAANQGQLDNEYRNGLRDQFAMAALTGLLASGSVRESRTVVEAFKLANFAMEYRNK